MNRYVFYSLAILLSLQIFPQAGNPILDSLKKKYESFAYRDVITIAENALQQKDKIAKHDLIQIHSYKAIAHFSIREERFAEKSFIEILKIDTGYVLNEETISPKIVSFYQGVKQAYIKTLPPVIPVVTDTIPKTPVKENPVIIQQPVKTETKTVIEYYFPYRSMILPGWEQIRNDDSPKGWVMASAAGVSFLSTVYFIFDCNSKQSDYLNESNRSLIGSKYSSYNTSYKIRNVSIAVFAAVWAAAQLDLLFFPPQIKQEQQTVYYEITPGIQPDGITLGLNLHF
jgi:hypothetical protein